MDWKSLIAELQAHDLSQVQIAETCGCGQATISDLAQGKAGDPRHSLGESLKSLLIRCQKGEKKSQFNGQLRKKAPFIPNRHKQDLEAAGVHGMQLADTPPAQQTHARAAPETVASLAGGV